MQDLTPIFLFLAIFLLEWFERLLPLIEEKLAAGELLVELT